MKKILVISIFLLFSSFAFGGFVIGIGGIYQSANIVFEGANAYGFTFYDDYNDGYYIYFNKIHSLTFDYAFPITLNFGFRGNNWSIMLYGMSLLNAPSYNELCIGWGNPLEFGVDLKGAELDISQSEQLPISSYGLSYAIINGHIFNSENTTVSRNSDCSIAYFGAYLRYTFHPFWIKISYTPFEFSSKSSHGITISDDEKTIYFTDTEDAIPIAKVSLSDWTLSAGTEYEF